MWDSIKRLFGSSPSRPMPEVAPAPHRPSTSAPRTGGTEPAAPCEAAGPTPGVVRPTDRQSSDDVVGWNGSKDEERLLSALSDQSEYDVKEGFRALALCVRSYLPFDEEADEAAHELCDLMYHGENRAWLASLVAGIPCPELQQKAADFCVERLVAGSKHNWPRAIAALPRELAGSCVDRLAAHLDDQRLLEVVWPDCSGIHAISSAVAKRLGAMLASDDEFVQRASATLIRYSQDASTETYKSKADAILRQEWSTLDSETRSDFLAAALLLDDADPDISAKSAAILARPFSRDSGSFDAAGIANAIQALVITRSPLTSELVSSLAGYFSVSYEMAIALGLMATRTDADDWLSTVCTEMLQQERVGTAALCAALGVNDQAQHVWDCAIDKEKDWALEGATMLACGGDPDALVAWTRYGINKAEAAEAAPSDVKSALSWFTGAACTVAALASRPSCKNSGLRWRLLTDLLCQDLPGGGYDLPLVGMHWLCQGGCLPQQSRYTSSEYVSKWLEVAHAIPMTKEVLEGPLKAMLVHTAGGVWVDDAYYRDPLCSMARLTGEEERLDNDQAEAMAEVMELVKVASASYETGRKIEAAATQSKVLLLLERLPVRGEKRIQFEADMHYWMMRYIFEAFQDAIDNDRDTDKLQMIYERSGGKGDHRLRTIASESAERAGELAELVGDEAISDYCRIFEKYSVLIS